jgi:hypothetical protein
MAIMLVTTTMLLIACDGVIKPNTDEKNGGWHGTASIGGYQPQSEYTSIAVVGQNIYISYYNQFENALKFIKSDDGGATWPDGNIKVLYSMNFETDSSLTAVGENVYLTYCISGGNLTFMKSTDGGTTWPTGNVVTVDPSHGTFHSSLAVDGEDVYLIYDGLRFAKSTDGGVTWPTANIKTVDASVTGQNPSLAVSGTNIYVSYYDFQNRKLKFAKSTDGGATWSAANIKNVDASGDVGYHSSIAVAGKYVYICYNYFDGTNETQKFAISNDGGATWLQDDIKIIGPGGFYNAIAAQGANVYITYKAEDIEGYAWLKIAKSTDSGATWPAENIKHVESAYYTDGSYNSLAVAGNNVYISYISWYDNSLWFAKSIDGGLTW